MRILVATYYTLPHVGGGTWYLHHVTRRLARRGHTVTVLAPRVSYRLAIEAGPSQPEPSLREERLNRTPLPWWWAPLAGLLLLRPKALHLARAADVILAQFHPHHSVAFAAVLAAKIVRRPVALRIEDLRRWMYGPLPGLRVRIEFVLDGLVNLVNEYASRHADLLLAVNSPMAERLERAVRGRPIVRVSPNGVDLETITNREDSASLREKLALPPSALIVAMVGRFSGKEYGVEVLLRAFESFRRREPTALLVLVGDGLPVGLEMRHREAIASGAIRITGPVPQETALAYTKAADVAVGPLGRTGTTPLKVVEALAVGTPVVLGEGSTGPEFSQFRERLVFTRAEPASLAHALEQALGLGKLNDPRTVATLLGTFGWGAISEGLEAALQEIATRRGESS